MIIGDASDFYRLRLTRLDVTDEPDLEWRDDILYREPPRQPLSAEAQWRVEAVSVDDDEDVTLIAMFDDADEARAFVESAQEDLEQMTRSAFEERYCEVEIEP